MNKPISTFTETDWKQARSALSEREVRTTLEVRSRLPANSSILTELSADEFIVRFRAGLIVRDDNTDKALEGYFSQTFWFFSGAVGLAILGHLFDWPIIIPVAFWVVAAFFLTRMIFSRANANSSSFAIERDQILTNAVLEELSALAEDRQQIRKLGG